MKREAGHEFLARLGKRRLRPGGIAATNWLLGKAEFGKDTRVLEVACNMGTTMVRIGRHYPCRVIGVDLDEGALEKAERNIRRAGLQDRLSVQRADAYCLPFPDQSFDILINEAMLTMLTGDGKDRALSEYCRVLKPGGLLLTHDVCFYEENPEKQRELRAGLSRVIRMNVEPLSVPGWKAILEKHSFRPVQRCGRITLMDPIGMIRDEGLLRAAAIIMRGQKKEEREMFRTMSRYFKEHDRELGYIASVSEKQ